MILLMLANPQKEGTPVNENISLQLSYTEKAASPDVYGIKEGVF